VHFVPQCIVVSHGDASIAEVIEWTNRQLILTKVYYRELWRRAILRAFILTFWLVAVLGSLAIGLFFDTQWLAATIAALTLLPVEIWLLFRGQGLWLKVLSGIDTDTETPEADNKAQQDISCAFSKETYERTLWQFVLAIPLAHLLLPWMTLYSLCTNRIKWRGITYLLLSPTETVVI
jgi:hypothetical protein